jgi:hypothetical protein
MMMFCFVEMRRELQCSSFMNLGPCFIPFISQFSQLIMASHNNIVLFHYSFSPFAKRVGQPFASTEFPVLTCFLLDHLVPYLTRN